MIKNGENILNMKLNFLIKHQKKEKSFMKAFKCLMKRQEEDLQFKGR